MWVLQARTERPVTVALAQSRMRFSAVTASGRKSTLRVVRSIVPEPPLAGMARPKRRSGATPSSGSGSHRAQPEADESDEPHTPCRPLGRFDGFVVPHSKKTW